MFNSNRDKRDQLGFVDSSSYLSTLARVLAQINEYRRTCEEFQAEFPCVSWSTNSATGSM